MRRFLVVLIGIFDVIYALYVLMKGLDLQKVRPCQKFVLILCALTGVMIAGFGITWPTEEIAHMLYERFG